MASASVRRKQVGYVRKRRISLRRTCALLQVARSTVGYQSRLATRDAPVIAAMRELSAQYPRFGYRRIQVFLARRGLVMSADRAYRIWKQAGLQVPRRRPRRRVATGRPRPLPATGANQVWAYDFVFDACANGQQLKCLTVIDEFTRECLAIDGGVPKHLRSDNGPEFVSRAVLRWLHEAGVETAPIDPGKPWQNGSNESFNGKFRDECLGMQWFKNRIDAKVAIEDWRRTHNGVRPHSSLNNLTPSEYARRISARSPEQAVF
jgi:putative transposase